MDFHGIMNDLMFAIVRDYGKKPVLNDQKDRLLDVIAKTVETVVETSYCDGVDLSVAGSGRDLIVSFFGNDIEIQDGRKNPFYMFAELADRADISSEDDTVHVAFTFFNMWELMPLE